MEGRPRVGDRVKLLGNHRYAGHSATYLTDRNFYESGQAYPVVKVDNYQEVGDRNLIKDRGEVFVMDPEHQMRKL
jgi:hypothetical protein